jgi:hypothetical protein
MGINLNPQRLGASFVRRKATRMVGEFMEGMNKDGRGAERVKKMIDTNRAIGSLVPPEKLAEYLAVAKQYSWASSMLSDQDLLAMLPPWVISTVRQAGQPGWDWLRAQIAWLRQQFSG